MKKQTIKKRDFNVVQIIKGEINCKPKVVRNRKIYTRKIKHKRNKDVY